MVTTVESFDVPTEVAQAIVEYMSDDALYCFMLASRHTLALSNRTRVERHRWATTPLCRLAGMSEAEGGGVRALEWARRRARNQGRKAFCFDGACFKAAAAAGRLETLRWLYADLEARGLEPRRSVTSVLNAAAKGNHAETVRWLLDTRGHLCCVAQSMRKAAAAGATEAFVALAGTYETYGCAFDPRLVAKVGSQEMLVWLYDKGVLVPDLLGDLLHGASRATLDWLLRDPCGYSQRCDWSADAVSESLERHFPPHVGPSEGREERMRLALALYVKHDVERRCECVERAMLAALHLEDWSTLRTITTEWVMNHAVVGPDDEERIVGLFNSADQTKSQEALLDALCSLCSEESDEPPGVSALAVACRTSRWAMFERLAMALFRRRLCPSARPLPLSGAIQCAWETAMWNHDYDALGVIERVTKAVTERECPSALALAAGIDSGLLYSRKHDEDNGDFGVNVCKRFQQAVFGIPITVGHQTVRLPMPVIEALHATRDCKWDAGFVNEAAQLVRADAIILALDAAPQLSADLDTAALSTAAARSVDVCRLLHKRGLFTVTDEVVHSVAVAGTLFHLYDDDAFHGHFGRLAHMADSVALGGLAEGGHVEGVARLIEAAPRTPEMAKRIEDAAVCAVGSHRLELARRLLTVADSWLDTSVVFVDLEPVSVHRPIQHVTWAWRMSRNGNTATYAGPASGVPVRRHPYTAKDTQTRVAMASRMLQAIAVRKDCLDTVALTVDQCSPYEVAAFIQDIVRGPPPTVGFTFDEAVASLQRAFSILADVPARTPNTTGASFTSADDDEDWMDRQATLYRSKADVGYKAYKKGDVALVALLGPFARNPTARTTRVDRFSEIWDLPHTVVLAMQEPSENRTLELLDWLLQQPLARVIEYMRILPAPTLGCENNDLGPKTRQLWARYTGEDDRSC